MNPFITLVPFITDELKRLGDYELLERWHKHLDKLAAAEWWQRINNHLDKSKQGGCYE